MRTFFIIAFLVCVALTNAYYAYGMTDALIFMSMITIILYIQIRTDKK